MASEGASSSSPMGLGGSTAAMRPSARNELANSGHDNNGISGSLSQWPSSGRSNLSRKQTHNNSSRSETITDRLFEDDEDLFRMEQQERFEFINGKRRPFSKTTAATSNTGIATNDDEDEFRGKGEKQEQHQLSVQNNANEISLVGDEWISSATNEDDLDGNNESSLSSNSAANHNDQTSSSSSSSSMNSIKDDTSFIGGGDNNVVDGVTTNYDGIVSRTNFREPSSVFTMDHYFSNSLDSTRMRLVKLVHRIAPELSCYTGSGEHYRGNVSVSVDKRTCMSWSMIVSSLSLSSSSQSVQQKQYGNMVAVDHNHCRNPNKDPHGPWCFVQYSEKLDGFASRWGHYEASNLISGIVWKDNNSSSGGHYKDIILHHGGTRFVPNSCSISPCSEYLWLYIVAPPFGLLILLSCLVTLLVRSIRKSHYKAMFSVKRHHGMPKFNRLLSMQSRFLKRKFGANRKKCGANYLDEDIFEIVDDLDWSDGQTQSLSPKSTTESLKLNSSFSSASTSNDMESKLSGCKSTNPIFCGDRSSTNDLFGGSEICNKSAVSQVGPMFATLRCHIQGGSSNKSRLANQATTAASSRQLFGNHHSKGPREQKDLASSSGGRFDNNAVDWIANQALSSSSDCNRAIQSQQKKQLTNESHLISCSTIGAGSVVMDSGLEASLNDCVGEKYIKGTELPQLKASSLVLAMEKQPIFEGKFSQVQLAYIEKEQEFTTTITDCNKETSLAAYGGDLSISTGHHNHQVAVCSLKTGTAIDPSTMKPCNLKLRNLNHLNLLKLIGYAQLNIEIGLTNNTNAHHCQTIPKHSLIYDMANLMDLSDWLKQQNEDIMTANEPGNDLRIRRNLTCFAKQLALAVDYLHDQGIIYRDLACRNCFLDPTKMLVKLASFNIELAAIDDKTATTTNYDDDNKETTDDSMMLMKVQNLRSMVRPKYLLDYYVIDSRPADCQLLPLSWIPLESILFNKFNKQTDVWSFGCLLYELFSLGKVAYFGYSSKQIIDAVRSNLMPPQPLLCPNGFYKLMCKCLSDIPSIRPNVKQIYEQLNLFSGQCSSFLDHHLCSLATTMYDDQFQQNLDSTNTGQLIELKSGQQKSTIVLGKPSTNSITKTKSYANIRTHISHSANRSHELSLADYDSLMPIKSYETRPETGKIPLSKSINLAGASRGLISGFGRVQGGFNRLNDINTDNNTNANHYDEPVVVDIKRFGANKQDQ